MATASNLNRSADRIVVGDDPNEQPVIYNNFLATERDQRRMLEGVKLSRRLVRNTVFGPLQAGELIPGDAIGDDKLTAVMAGNLATYGHPTSTVPMGGANDPSAVVDSVGTVRAVSTCESSMPPSSPESRQP